MRLTTFNEAGVGRDLGGFAALALLQAHGFAGCSLSHHSARIGQASSTLEHGVISHANAAAAALGAAPGIRLQRWLAILAR